MHYVVLVFTLSDINHNFIDCIDLGEKQLKIKNKKQSIN